MEKKKKGKSSIKFKKWKDKNIIKSMILLIFATSFSFISFN